MKVLHIQAGFELGFPGGITKYVHSICRAQLDIGLEVVVLAEQQGDYDVDSRIQQVSASHNRLTRFCFNQRLSHSHDKRIIDHLSEVNADIIHVHCVYGLSWRILDWIRNSNIPYIVTLHDYYFLCPRITMTSPNGEVCHNISMQKCQSCISNLEGVNAIQAIYRKAHHSPQPLWRNFWIRHRMDRSTVFLNRAERIISVSSRVAQILRDSPAGLSSEVITIGNESADWDTSEKVAADRLRLVFLGTLSPHKGADVFFELARRVKNDRISFEFYGRAGQREKAEMAKLKILDHGPYDVSDLRSVIDNIDLGLVLPIWEDNGPQVVMELINSGTPILATRRGGIPDFVSDGSGVLFEPNDPDAVTDIINWLNALSLDSLAGFTRAKLKSQTFHARELANLYAEVLRQ